MKRKLPLRDSVFDALKEDICSQRLGAGEKLLEIEIARRFRVSRTPVREALQQLAREGFVDYRLNVGATVKKNTSEDLAELFEVSAVLEGYVTQMVTRRCVTKKDVAYLTMLQSKMQEFAAAKDFHGWESMNRLFHDFFLQRGHNKMLKAIADNLRSKMYMNDTDKLPVAIHVDAYMQAHNDIIEAVAAGKAARAGSLMRSHILSIHSNLLESRRLRQEYAPPAGSNTELPAPVGLAEQTNLAAPSQMSHPLARSNRLRRA